MAINIDYDKIYQNKRVLILPDVFPWSGVHQVDKSVMEGVVRNVTVSTNAEIGTAEIDFPKKIFGDHIKGLTPIKICIDDLDNIFFRGFITQEKGILSENEDIVRVTAKDYKWYFSKCTRIRGRWFTSTGRIPESYGNPNTLGYGKLKYEMFRAPCLREDGEAGYIQTEPCVFNEGGLPTCNTKTRDGKLSIFKYRRIYQKNGIQYIEKYNYGAHYWTFSSILAHIVYYWLNPYSGIMTQFKISNNSFAHLSKLTREEEIPFNLSIEGMNPLEAIDEVVKQIPGSWIWYLSYYGNVVYINIVNMLNDVGHVKKFYVGDGSKQAEKPSNVADITVTRDWEESSSFIIIKGGKIKLCSTVELKPVYETKTVTVDGETIENCPFEDNDELNEWLDYLNNTQNQNTVLTVDKKEKFEKAFRYYCIPKEGELLQQALDAVTYMQSGSVRLSGRLRRMYSVIETQLRKMLVYGIDIDRDYEAPLNVEFENPVFFAYDEYKAKPMVKLVDISDDDKEELLNKIKNKKIIYFDNGVNFNADTGLVIFDKPQICYFYTDTPIQQNDNMVVVEPGEEYEINLDKTSIDDMINIKGIADINSQYHDLTGDNTKYHLKSRRIFCTLTISLDLPYIVGDDVFGLNYNEGGNFARYIDFEGNDLKIHVNAFYPIVNGVPNGLIPKEYYLTNDIKIDKDMCGNILYPIDALNDYEMFVDGTDKILLQKLDNAIKATKKFKEDLEIDIGYIDYSYKLGDIIIAIENSRTENPDSGYYNLRDYISRISIVLEGESNSYTTKISATNQVNYTPGDFDKDLVKIYRRPSILRGVYKVESYYQVEEKE